METNSIIGRMKTTIFTITHVQTKRSTVMRVPRAQKLAAMVVGAFMILIFGVTGAHAQGNLILRDGVNYSGSGTINVKNDISNTNMTSPATIGGTVNLTGTASTQNIGNAGKPSITFSTLKAQGSTIKQMNVTVTVSDTLDVNSGQNFDVNTDTLNLAKAATLTSGSLDVTDASSVVNFTRNDATAQTVFGLDYAGTLGMSGSSAKNLGGATSAATVTQAGGDLTVNNKLAVSGTGTFATIADISDSLNFGATANGSITAVTTVGGGSLTSNSSNAISIGTLGGNTGTVTAAGSGGLNFTTSATNGTGTIEAQAGTITFAALAANAGIIRTTGAGNLTFTGAAANEDSIYGYSGSGAIAFSSTLTQTAGKVVGGSGNVSFASTVTNDASSSIYAGTGSTLDFNGDVGNNGTIQLAGTGSATFAGSFTTSGTLTLASGSNWTYDGAAQNMAGGGSVTYGNLLTAGSGTKTALGTMTVAGNFDNGGTGNAAITTDMGLFNLSVTGTRDNTNGTLQFGGATNGLAFADTSVAAGTVVYNGVFASGTVDSQQVAAGSYHLLQFANNAPKVILTNTTVSTGSDVSLGTNVALRILQNAGNTTIFNIGGNGVGTFTLASSSTLLNEGALNIGGDLDIAGALTNNGTVTVGY